MALKRMVLQIGMGTDIRGADYTKAAVRALRDALWHNSLSVANALGQLIALLKRLLGRDRIDLLEHEPRLDLPAGGFVQRAALVALGD